MIIGVVFNLYFSVLRDTNAVVSKAHPVCIHSDLMELWNYMRRNLDYRVPETTCQGIRLLI